MLCIKESLVLNPVVQEEATGCGIAAVANILGKSYSKMKASANAMGIRASDKSLWSDTQYVRRMLSAEGVRTSAEEKRFESWDALPDLARWSQESSATRSVYALISCAMTSSGVCQSRALRGRPLRSLAISLSCVWLSVDRSVPFGRNWRNKPLVFSLLPRCQGAYGSANQMSIFKRCANSL